MSQTALKLQPSETAVFHGATRIYAAYIMQGVVSEGSEQQWMAKATTEAIQLALTAEEAIQSDDEKRKRDPITV
jgi:hypothetical protein